MNMLNINQLLRHIITLLFSEHYELNNVQRCEPLPQCYGTGSHIHVPELNIKYRRLMLK